MVKSEHLDIARKVSVLKDVKRQGWARKGIDPAESVADHVFMVSFMTLMFGKDEELNIERMIKMALVHDVGESIVGDVVYESGTKIVGSLRTKHNDERKAVNEIFNALPEEERGEYVDLWEEWAAQTTPEAKFVKQIEKIEMVIQALAYEEQGYNPELFNEFWENARKYLKGNKLEPMLDELERQRGK